MFESIRDYARWWTRLGSDIYVVFTKILWGRNLCFCHVTELKFAEHLQMASLSLSSQFETNFMSNRKVIELLLQLKSAKAHDKNYIKVKLPWSGIFSVIAYCHHAYSSAQAHPNLTSYSTLWQILVKVSSFQKDIRSIPFSIRVKMTKQKF